VIVGVCVGVTVGVGVGVKVGIAVSGSGVGVWVFVGVGVNVDVRVGVTVWVGEGGIVVLTVISPGSCASALEAVGGTCPTHAVSSITSNKNTHRNRICYPLENSQVPLFYTMLKSPDVVAQHILQIRNLF
jgi:hypothetical protein